MFDIVTFGSAVIDTFVDTELNKKTGSFSYPAGSKILVHGMDTHIGGGATNTAVAFARLGFKTGCVCKIGDGTNSNRIMKMFKQEKIRFLGKRSKDHTGHSIILDSRSSKSRTVLTYKGCGNDLLFDEVSSFKTKWIYFSSQMGKSYQTQIKMAEYLAGKKTKIAFNPSEYAVKELDLKKMLKLTNVLICNKTEAQLLASKYKKKGNLLKALWELGPEIVVITDGPKPAYAYNGIKGYVIKPKKVNVVEVTGAGDAFAAGFVAGLMVNKPIEDALKLGLEEGTAVLKHFGAKNNLLRRKLR